MFSKFTGHHSKHVTPIGNFVKFMGQSYKPLSTTMNLFE